MTSGYYMLTERDRSAMRRDAQADEAGAKLDAIRRAEVVALTEIRAALRKYADTVSANLGDFCGPVTREQVDKAGDAIRDYVRDLSFHVRSDLEDMECGFGRYSEEG